jgi:tripartite-type tricarboxylate transporter receptor subunit TctC
VRVLAEAYTACSLPPAPPKVIIERIGQATQALLRTRDYQQMLIEIGFEAIPESSPDEFRQVLAADVALWTPLVKSLGLKIF